MADVNNKLDEICVFAATLINFENTFQKLLFNQLPYSLWMTIVIFIDKAHSWKKYDNLNENDPKRFAW